MQFVHVAAGVLRRADGKVLVARRDHNAHQGGLWEFPGGKLETDESVPDALSRELKEELGIQVLEARPLISVAHVYTDRKVLLDTWLVSRWQGQAQGREGQPLSWLDPRELDDLPMPPADIPIVKAIRLPDVYLITPPAVTHADRFLEELETALMDGVSLLQFRVFGLPEDLLENLARAARDLCEKHGARMLLNGPLERVRKVAAHGWHLDRRQLGNLVTARDYPELLMGASCHDAQELAMAGEKGLDFALLSPVLPTASHPDAELLGWERFSDLVSGLPLPVYALGGMNRAMLEQSWQAGAQGIAGIRGLWPGVIPE
ncbi:Nudix family hydrolase [Thiolapillus sp.]